jgi:hypothetical protein
MNKQSILLGSSFHDWCLDAGLNLGGPVHLIRKPNESGPRFGDKVRPTFQRSSLESARLLELGRQIPVDLKADANFDKSRSCPDHKTFLPVSVRLFHRSKNDSAYRQGDNLKSELPRFRGGIIQPNALPRRIRRLRRSILQLRSQPTQI